MEAKTLTPMQLWNEFEPTELPLKVNIINSVDYDGFNETEYFFTALKGKEEDVRGYVRVLRPLKEKTCPVVVYIPDYQEKFEYTEADALIEKGYALASFDYNGMSKYKGRGITYPKDFEYGYFKNAGAHLTATAVGLENTCQFLWSKIIRRVISMLCSLPYIDKDNIALLSVGDGAELLWQVAGTDKRIKAILPILNCGWADYIGYNKYGENTEPPITDELLRKNICCSPQAYAKSVDAKVYFVGASNNAKYSVDRISDTFKLLKNQKQNYQLIDTGLTNQIYDSSIKSIITWIGDVFDNKNTPVEPIIKLNVIEGKLECALSADAAYDDIKECYLSIAYGDTASRYRNWRTFPMGVAIDGSGKHLIKVFNCEERLFTFATITYKNGLSLSTSMVSVVPNTLGEIATDIKANRIVYDKKMAASVFYAQSSKKVLPRDSVQLLGGALDILGITTLAGDLLSYNIVNSHKEDSETLLQFDAFCTTVRELKVQLVDKEDKIYEYKVCLNNVEEWQKINLDAGDFKDSEMISLKCWQRIKCIIFKDAQGVLINNILWV